MKSDKRRLRDLLGEPALYGERNSSAGDAWRDLLLSRRPRKARPRVASQAAELRRLALLIVLPLVVIVALTFYATLGLPGLSRLTGWSEQLGGLRPATPALLVNPYFWLLPMALSALLTFLSRKRMPRLLPLDW